MDEESLIVKADLEVKKYKNYINNQVSSKDKDKKLEKKNSKKDLSIENLLSKELREYPIVRDDNIFNSLFNVCKKIEDYLKSNKYENNPRELIYYRTYIKDRLLVPNIRLVRCLAINILNKYENLHKNIHMELMDLINEGSKGLIKAFEKFNPEKGIKFNSYASVWIKQKIGIAIRNESRIIRIPINKQGHISQLNKQENDLETKLERGVTIEELSKKTNLSTQKIREIKRYDNYDRIISLDFPSFDGDSDSLLNCVPDKRYFSEDRFITRDFIERLFKYSNITDREKDMLIRQAKGETLKKIGDKYDLTKERIRQIINNTIYKIKKHDKEVKILEKLKIRLKTTLENEKIR